MGADLEREWFHAQAIPALFHPQRLERRQRGPFRIGIIVLANRRIARGSGVATGRPRNAPRSTHRGRARERNREMTFDKYGNPIDGSRVINCCFPDCGCDGARLCIAENGASGSSVQLNLEHKRIPQRTEAKNTYDADFLRSVGIKW